jgi:hypothetical protein
VEQQHVDWQERLRDNNAFFLDEVNYDTASETPIGEVENIVSRLRRSAGLDRDGWTSDMFHRFTILVHGDKATSTSRPLRLSPKEERLVAEAAAIQREREAVRIADYERAKAEWDQWEAGGCVGDDPGIRNFRVSKAKYEGIVAPGYESYAPGGINNRVRLYGVPPYQTRETEEPEPAKQVGASPEPEICAVATGALADEDFRDDDQDEEPHDDGIPADLNDEPVKPLDADEPLDVFGSLAPEPVLEPDMLPKAIRDFVFDTAPRLGNTPAVLAMAALSVCAAALNDGIRIQPKQHDTTWTERACLWLTIVGVPGTNKTAAFNAAKAPLLQVEKLWADQDRAAFAKYERDMEVWQAEHAAWKKATRSGEETGLPPEEPKKPGHRQIVVNDFTMDSLSQDVLADNPHGVLLQFDELMALLGSLDAYNNGHKDRPRLLQLFDGGQMVVNRRSSGRTITDNWSACILGGIQEDKLAVIAPKMTDDGLFQRFLPVRGANVAEDQDRLPDREARENYEFGVLALANLKPDREPVVLSPEAQAYRREVDEIARAIRDIPTFPPGLREHANKIRGIFARLLLTLHAVECAPRFRDDEFATVPGRTARMARDLMVRFFIPNAIRIYKDYFGGCDQHGVDVQWIAGHILGRSYQTVRARDIYRANGKFEDEKRLARAMQILADCNWLRPIEPRRFGDKPSEWAVNPRIYMRHADRAAQEREHREAVRKQIATHENKLMKAWS